MPSFLRTAVTTACLALVTACGGSGEETPIGNPTPPLACLALPAEASFHDDPASSEWKDVLVDWRNRVWIAGYERGRYGETNIEPSGDARGVLRLLSGAGELLFDSGARLDSAGADVAEALALDANGMLSVAGRTTGVLAGSTNRGQFDLFVARVDATAPAAAWRLVQAGDERPQRPRRIQALGTDKLLVAGYDDDFVPSNFVADWSDSFAAQFNVSTGAAPTLAWEHQNGSAEPDTTVALATHEGHVFMGGTVAAGAQRGMFVRKLAADGQPLWTARYTALGIDRVAALMSLPDGSLLMAGSVEGSWRGGVPRGGQDAFVARINPENGAVIWSVQLGSAGSDWVTDAKVDAQGRIWLYGETDGAFTAGRTPDGSTDLFALQLRADGSLLRSWQWGTAADEAATSLALDSCGRAVAVGSTGDNRRRRAVMWFPQGQ
jgi:outer membrane protein assembly factor BamB